MFETFKAWRQERQRLKRLSKYYSVQYKISDRPHPLTVRLALVSPLLALAAVGISYVSLGMNRQSMEIGQRAYLTVTNLQISRKSEDVVMECDIRNLGNTPARITLVDSHLFEDRDLLAFDLDKSGKMTLGPKDVSHRHANYGHITGMPTKLIVLTIYFDAFGHQYALEDCWDIDQGLSAVSVCDATEENEDFAILQPSWYERLLILSGFHTFP